MSKKYELLEDDYIDIDKVIGDPNSGRRLYRIRSLRCFQNITIAESGGYIEKESNLSHNGECWVNYGARVYGEAEISGNALISGEARVYGNAKVFGNSVISGNSHVDFDVSGNNFVSTINCVPDHLVEYRASDDQEISKATAKLQSMAQSRINDDFSKSYTHEIPRPITVTIKPKNSILLDNETIIFLFKNKLIDFKKFIEYTSKNDVVIMCPDENRFSINDVKELLK